MTEPLQRDASAVGHPPRRWIRRFLAISLISIAALALGGVLLVKRVLDRPAEQDCATAARSATAGAAVLVCQREYERTRHPATGARLANSLLQSGSSEAAGALANNLLTTSARADALYVLGQISAYQGRLDRALEEIQEARKLHREQNARAMIAKDDLVLAQIQTRRDQYAEALQSLDECVDEARGGDEPAIEGHCHLTAARVLSYVGYFEAAQQELDRARPLFASDYDLMWLWFERGNLEQLGVRGPRRLGHNQQAVRSFEQALELARRVQETDLVLSIILNLAYSHAEIGAPDVADRYLAEAGVLDLEKRYEGQRAQLAARIAFHRDNLTLAASINDRVYPTIEGGDQRIVVAMMQVRIALAQSDLRTAERWARLGVEEAEQIRAAQTVVELRPWVLASRREPYEMLFTVLARSEQTDEAIKVFDQWQGRTLLDALARPSAEATPRLSSTASMVRGLGHWLPSASRAPLMAHDGRAVIDALRRIDLIALAVADGDVWRLTIGSRRSRRSPTSSIASAPTRPRPRSPASWAR
jgi:tetratricopeptide (TPR) repeat protein